MAQKILFTFSAQDVGVAAAQDAIKDRQKAINAEIKAAKALGSPYTQLLGESVKLKRETEALSEQQKLLNREFKTTTVPKDSLAGLRLEYQKLSIELSKLTAAERGSSFGKGLVKNAANVKKEIDGIEQSIGRFTGNVGNYKSAISGVVNALAAVGIGFGVSEIINTTREFEKLFATLKQATGSESKANKIFADIQTFAKETPFQLNEVVGAFVKLENRNFSPTIEQLRTLGDIASSQGKSLDQFVEAVLDAQTGEFERLKEFGIVARKNGEDVKLSFRGQSETFKNTSENITQYLLKLGQLPTIQGSAVAVAKTLDGSISNLIDNFAQLAAGIGGTGGFLKGVVDAANDLISVFNDLVSVPLSEKIREQQTEFNALIGVLADVNASEDTRNRAIAELTKNYPEYIGNINLESASQTDLNGLLDSGNQLFERRIFLQQNEEELAKFAEQRLKTERLIFEAQKDLQKIQQSGQAGTTAVRFGANDVGADRVFENRGDAAASRVEALRGQLEILNTRQKAFTDDQDKFAFSLFGTADAAAAAAAAAKKLADEEKKNSGGGGGSKADKEKSALAGSLDAAKEALAKLNKEIDATPTNSPQLQGLIDKAVAAQKQVQFLEEKLENLRNPKTPITDDQRALQDFGFPDPDEAIRQAKEARDKIGAALGQQITGPDSGILGADDERLAEIRRKLDQEDSDKKKAPKEAADEERKQLRDAVVSQAIDSAQTIADGVFGIKQAEIDRELNAELSALDKKEQAAIDAAGGNAVKEKAIRANFEKQRAELERQAARKRKELSKKEALVNIALAITKALTGGVPPFNLILAAGAAIAGAVQLSAINAQEFAGGGAVKQLKPGIINEKQNAPRTSRGDTVLAYVKPGEMLLNERQQMTIRQMAGNSIFDDAGVPGASRSTTAVPYFASGGVVDFTPQTTFASGGAGGQSLNAQATFSEGQIRSLANVLAGTIADTVAVEVRKALALGLDDSTRRLEREQNLTVQREG